MNTFSPEYWRGVTAAYDVLYEGEAMNCPNCPDSLSEWFLGDDSDYANGIRAQCKAWPVKILVPAEMEPRTTNFGCAVLSGLALALFLFALIGWPKLPAPWLGGILVAAVICLIGAYRDMR